MHELMELCLISLLYDVTCNVFTLTVVFFIHLRYSNPCLPVDVVGVMFGVKVAGPTYTRR